MKYAHTKIKSKYIKECATTAIGNQPVLINKTVPQIANTHMSLIIHKACAKNAISETTINKEKKNKSQNQFQNAPNEFAWLFHWFKKSKPD